MQRFITVLVGILIGTACLSTSGHEIEFQDPHSPGPQPDLDASQKESLFLARARQLTFQGRRAGEGYFSSNGRELVLQSEREIGNPFYQIYTLDLNNGLTKLISPGQGKTTCAFFSPNGRRILFASTHHDPLAAAKQQEELDFRNSGKTRRYSWDYDDQMELYETDRRTGKTRRLTHTPGYDAEGSYSPNGSWIAFTSLRSAYDSNSGQLIQDHQSRWEKDPAYFGEIYLMKSDGSRLRRLTDWPGYDGGPFFTPDGERIVWRHFAEDGLTADVYTMKLDGSDRRRITDFQSMAWAPYFHPSGKYLIFTSNKLGFSNFELFIVAAQGGDPVRVTFTDSFDGLPVFSPDGARLCWTSNRGSEGASQLWMADWNHAEALHSLGLKQRGGPGKSTSRRGAGWKPAATPDVTKTPAGVLSSDAMEGRMTGTAGARKAADYIAEQFQKSGLLPVGTLPDYFQPFDYPAGVEFQKEQSKLDLIAGENRESLTADQAWRPLAFSASGAAEGEVVFAGYGLNVPGTKETAYDSYAGLDVKGKIVLVLRYVPEKVEPARRQELNRYAGLRYKALVAREKGAKALLVVGGPNSPNAGTLIPLANGDREADAGILAASIDLSAADRLLKSGGRTVAELQSALDNEDPHYIAPSLGSIRASCQIQLKRLRGSDRNVLAYLPPARPTPESSPEFIMIGAHYDHLGRGESDSLHAGASPEIHNGADDNASGVAVVLELARQLNEARRKDPKHFSRGVLFCLWSGEEIGLIGSAYLAEHPPLPLTNAIAYLNFDMVGRLQDRKLALQGAGSSPAWGGLIERANITLGLDLSVQSDPYLPTDVTSIYPRGVPVLSFFTGSHEDYHKPGDDVEKLNFQGMDQIRVLAQNIVKTLLDPALARPVYTKVQQANDRGTRESLRAYLGTIPDYAQEVKGVKISGARGGSPADKAGMKAGDIIVELAGQKILNIYDYTYALDAVKIGQPIQVKLMRAGVEVVVTVTPEARK